MKFTKDLIKTIVIIVLIVLLLGIFVLPSIYNSIYSKGIGDGQLDVIQTQTQTGNIFVVVNNTITGYPISAFCGGNI